MKTIFSFFILLSFSTLAVAQEMPDNFKKYITKNITYTETLENKFADLFEYIFPQCEQNAKLTRLKPKTLLPFVSLEEQHILKTHPYHGQWVESAIGKACNQSSRFNLLVTAYDIKRMPLLHPLINGKTLIEPLGQSKAEQAIKKILTVSKNCRTTTAVMDTTFLGYKTQDNKRLSIDDNNLGWFEQWIVDGCGSLETINLAILPDPKTKYRYVAKVK